MLLSDEDNGVRSPCGKRTLCVECTLVYATTGVEWTTLSRDAGTRGRRPGDVSCLDLLSLATPVHRGRTGPAAYWQRTPGSPASAEDMCNWPVRPAADFSCAFGQAQRSEGRGSVVGYEHSVSFRCLTKDAERRPVGEDRDRRESACAQRGLAVALRACSAVQRSLLPGRGPGDATLSPSLLAGAAQEPLVAACLREGREGNREAR